MSASRLSATVAAVAAVSTFQNCALADSSSLQSFLFFCFTEATTSGSNREPERAGFDPEALERGAKALREINSSPHAKQYIINYAYLEFRNPKCDLLRWEARSRLNNVRLRKRAEIEQETIRVKAMVEAEGQDIEVELSEEHNRRILIEHINGEREKWLAAINSTFSHIEGGFRTLLTDQSKLIMTVGGATTLAARIYTTRFYSYLGYINRILGQPSLIRESSILISQAKNKAMKYSTAAGTASSLDSKNGFRNIILYLATANSKTHQAPFHIIDGVRNSMHMSEAQQSALNALFFCNGDQLKDKVLALTTNKPGDLDSAITDRINEVIEFPLPGTYLSSEGDNGSSRGSLFKRPQKITVYNISEDVTREAAKKTEGFSGREIAKLMASVQAAVYGRPDFNWSICRKLISINS
ncbi:ATPase family AAA domain-containing protein [Salix suchowensis]|nr:ATPase family AAA domain-containing protein [Salix suchowensis]